MRRIKYDSGFTLIEILVVVSIVAVIIAIAVPVFNNQLVQARIAADQANVRILNSVSKAYGVSHGTISGDIFQGIPTDTARIDALINDGYLGEPPVVQQEDKRFVWSTAGQTWHTDDASYVLTGDSITLGSGYYQTAITGYSGSETNIVIPGSINGTAINTIYQDSFKHKGLTQISFSGESTVTRIHARAFQDNALTSVSLPNSLTRIDFGAFSGNPNLNSVSIGANVTTIEGNAFNGGDSFKNLYFSAEGGAGTYLFKDGVWVKSS